MVNKIFTFLFFSTLIFSNKSFSQFDTSYYQKYSDLLGVGIFQSIRNNTIVLEKLHVTNTTAFNEVRYNINGKAVTGFILNYDKIYFAFGFKTTQSNNDFRKGNSNYSNYVLQLGTNKLVIEGGYRKYKGFYDAGTPQHIQPFTDSTLYYQDKNLESRNYKIKTLYFLNHKKFSYNSAYFGSYRQLRSAASWLLGANFYVNKIVSDTSLIPPYARDIFANYSMLKEIHVTGFSFGGEEARQT